MRTFLSSAPSVPPLRWQSRVGECALLVVLLLGSPAAIFAQAPVSTPPSMDAAALLERAMDNYHRGMDSQEVEARLESFRQARRLLQKIADSTTAPDSNSSPVASAPLYLNIGNSALLARELGPAILAYRRALQIDPNHKGARSNLLHARNQLPTWVPRPDHDSIADNLLFFHWSLSSGEKSLLAAAMFFLASVLVALSIWKRGSGLRNLAILPAIAWLTLVVSWSIGSDDPSAAVITHEEVEARSADNDRAPARFGNALPAGTEVIRLEVRGPWAQIQLADGRQAWVESGAVELVDPNSRR